MISRTLLVECTPDIPANAYDPCVVNPQLNPGGGVHGGIVGGTGTLVFIPQAPICEQGAGCSAPNQVLFWVISNLGIGSGSGSATQAGEVYQVTAPIAKGATSFTGLSTAGLVPGSRLILFENYFPSGTHYTDWATVERVSGNTVYLTAPMEMAFPDDDPWVTEPYAVATNCTGAQAVLSLGVTGAPGPLSGTAAISMAGKGCPSTGMKWNITGGGGTAGSAVINATVAGGEVTAASVTPGDSAGFVLSPNSGLGYRIVKDLNAHFTFEDFTVQIPLVSYNSAATSNTGMMDTHGTDSLTLDNIKCWVASGICFATNLDYGDRLINNQFYSGHTELAWSVHMTIDNNLFDKRAGSINQNRASCAGAQYAAGVDIDLGSGFVSFTNNQVLEACSAGIANNHVVHDSVFSGNTVGWVQSPGETELTGIGFWGGYNNLITDNTLDGADGTYSIGIYFADDPAGAGVKSNANVASYNNVSGFKGADYGLNGSLGTDCVTYEQNGTVTETCAKGNH
jgi:hypothetical protein